MMINSKYKVILADFRHLEILPICLSGFLILFCLFSQTIASGPKPSGNYSVGTVDFSLVDDSRPETLTKNPNDRRELYVRVWYPAQDISADLQPLPIFGRQTKEITETLAERLKFPRYLSGLIANIPSNSYADATPASSKDKFPVIVFSHGYYLGFAAQNPAQMEELASHGYVVFGIGHTYETIINVFPDGRSVPAIHNPFHQQPNPKADKLLKKYQESKTAAEKNKFARRYVLVSPAKERLTVWTADVRFVLNEIEKMETGKTKSIFTQKLDLTRVGIMGMSFGGATAGQVCLTDNRCRAGINMDGIQFGDVYTKGLSRPFMFMDSEVPETEINRQIYEESKVDSYYLKVKGAKHMNFSMFNMMVAFDKEKKYLGEISGERMEKIMSSYILAFFNKYLNNSDSRLLENSSEEFSEVVIFSKTNKQK